MGVCSCRLIIGITSYCCTNAVRKLYSRVFASMLIMLATQTIHTEPVFVSTLIGLGARITPIGGSDSSFRRQLTFYHKVLPTVCMM